jgi:hypothetical protein
MARVIVGSYMFRYPLGGMLSWVLQYLLGLKKLGHDVYFVEKYGYDLSCYNPVTNTMSDDCSYGLSVVSGLLSRFGFGDRWCYVEKGDEYHGISKKQIEEVFASADIFIDMGTHGSWQTEAEKAAMRVWIDGEPGYTQIKLFHQLEEGKPVHKYNRYFTNGLNVGVNGNIIPTIEIKWGHLLHPVDTDLFPLAQEVRNASYSTVMNWVSHETLEYNGKAYGQKNIEFEKFISLPLHVDAGMEVAVSGNKVPRELLQANGWKIEDGRRVTVTFDSFKEYICASRGEFSVCKNVFIDTHSGWFSDKSAAYLSSGRPVILQDTGFSTHLPCGTGLFAVRTQEDAVLAIKEIESNYEKHSRAAREIAMEFFNASKVMQKFLDDLY